MTATVFRLNPPTSPSKVSPSSYSSSIATSLSPASSSISVVNTSHSSQYAVNAGSIVSVESLTRRVARGVPASTTRSALSSGALA